jgi:DNA-binding NarL/FixJ family response regulator
MTPATKSDSLRFGSTTAAAHPRGGRFLGGDMELLTKREREIAELISHGLSLKEMAARLNVTRGTVDTHARHIREKWRVTNAAALTRRFVEWELLRKDCYEIGCTPPVRGGGVGANRDH